MRVAIDVGGTFTDLVALDDSGGGIRRIKVPSTPQAPERAVLHALERLTQDVDPAAIRFVGHASTVATNALLGQVGLDLPRVALLTTEGFRDVLEIGRQNRAELYNLMVRRPEPLVPRALRFGVRERMLPDGSVFVPLDPAWLHTVCEELAGADVAAVAVCYLHSYVNPAHERATGAALQERLPDVVVALSSELDPEYREYERSSTTVVHALLGPLVRGYLERLADGVRARGVAAGVFVMQSNGGMASLEHVAERPATLLESGPAAGVIGAGVLGTLLGLDKILSFDMGGTTAKAGIVIDGQPQVVHEFEAAGRTHSGRAVKGSGYPVRFPFVDLAEISAGGGTIARVDAGGGLHVGPLSAGAEPGPAAYGRGTDATVTDADLVLGRINPRALLGGALPLDLGRAEAALDRLLPGLNQAGAAEGLDRAALAAGIVRIVDTEMAKVARIVSVERGHDPRDFTLVAFGGSGPLHACAVADELGVRRIVIPPDPGLFSAHGLLAADLRVSAVTSSLEPLHDVEPERVDTAFAQLEASGFEELALQGIAPADMRFARELELRYAGQSFELSIACSAQFDAAARDAAALAFHARHKRTYGFAANDEIELVTLRSTAIGLIPKTTALARRADAAATADRAAQMDDPAAQTDDPAAQKDDPAAQTEDPVAHGVANNDAANGTSAGSDATNNDAATAVLERRALHAGEAGQVTAAVYARELLRPGMRFAGPALVEQYDATTFVAPGWRAEVDSFGDMLLERT
jgi:N-methylhydantoinase A